MRKSILKTSKRVRDSAAPTVRNPTTSSYTTIIYRYAENLGQSHRGPLGISPVSVSALEHRLVDSVGVLVVFLTPLLLPSIGNFIDYSSIVFTTPPPPRPTPVLQAASSSCLAFKTLRVQLCFWLKASVF